MFFGSASADIKFKDSSKLNAFASKARKVNLQVIIAIGHADSQETSNERTKHRLSIERAESAKNALVDSGIEKNRFYTEGKGQAEPIADNSSSEGRAKNRRVMIEVVRSRVALTSGT